MKIHKKRTRIKNLESGSLFVMDSGTIGLKTDYYVDDTCLCYIVGDGSRLTGGQEVEQSNNSAETFNNLLVSKIEL